MEYADAHFALVGMAKNGALLAILISGKVPSIKHSLIYATLLGSLLVPSIILGLYLNSVSILIGTMLWIAMAFRNRNDKLQNDMV